MTTGAKRAVKRFIIRWELWFYGVTTALYATALVLTFWLFPDVGNLTIQLTLLFTGFTSAVGSFASAVKADDTEE